MSKLAVIFCCFFFVAVPNVLGDETSDANYEKDVEDVLDYIFAPCEEKDLSKTIFEDIEHKKENLESEKRKLVDLITEKKGEMNDLVVEEAIEALKDSKIGEHKIKDLENVEEIFRKCDDEINAYTIFVKNTATQCLEDKIANPESYVDIEDFDNEKQKLENYSERATRCNKDEDCLRALQEEMVDDNKPQASEDMVANISSNIADDCMILKEVNKAKENELIDKAKKCMVFHISKN